MYPWCHTQLACIFAEVKVKGVHDSIIAGGQMHGISKICTLCNSLNCMADGIGSLNDQIVSF
ncbi:MAG: hypothetical protein CO065_15815 [Comamonadaceae bacterium CG_4_9_14_0_8_um_filter_57_21]|nr:MAG: hypothetical protein CO065_15815 [Comamonadaceae bacterium CG_4_9_14_0_8_um_filter_57_21]